VSRVEIPCPICEQHSPRLWATDIDGNVIAKCRECGMRYVNPRPADELLADMYEHHYTREAEPLSLGAEDFRQVLVRDYQSMDRILKYTKSMPESFLDIGTGSGSFPKMLRLAGFQNVEGTDLTDANTRGLNEFGIRLSVGDLEEIRDRRFDVVTAQHVLEHVPEPNAFLTSIRNLLNPAGVLHVLVPNEASFNSRYKTLLSRLRLKKRLFGHLAARHHLYFYERSTLCALLEKNGFAIRYCGTQSSGKPSRLHRVTHDIMDAVSLGTWLEVVAVARDPNA